MLPALILAGGKGTRLIPRIGSVPKPLAPIGERPFLAILIGSLHKQGISAAYISIASAHRVAFEEFVGEMRGSKWGPSPELHLVEESQALGTGGALVTASPSLPGERFLAVNGDTLFAGDLRHLAETHAQEKGVAATLALAPAPPEKRFGSVVFDGSRITQFAEKKDSGGAWVYAGIGIFEKSALREFPDHQALSLENDLFPKWCRDRKLAASPCVRYFHDIGVPESFDRTAEFLLQHPEAF